MVILIGGGTHTGKTALAQRLLEEFKYPYLSIDHIKMGLIRSGYTKLSPESVDSALTEYLWPVICGIIKTNIENSQNIIIEGCYIPFDWQKDFEAEYLKHIKYKCLILSEKYITQHFDDIIKHQNIIEQRLDCGCCIQEALIEENKINLDMCVKHGLDYILIDDKYDIDIQTVVV